ncbi:hypothetical protein [Streptomyces boninensis]|uniref:hypothetical protein n=1 Tax=Streptomyces boninensis TaxID=2039455 RepID=UPI003B227BCD
MAHNPQGQAPGPMDDPAGNTQMFRAFVDEGGPQQQRRVAAPESSGSRVGVIVGVIAVVVVLAGAAWLALS